MVFHEIDSILDVISGHRIIIYYIINKHESTKHNETRLFTILQTVMEMWGKKNDDLLIVKVLHPSEQFIQFQNLYIPEVTGIVTLFVVNNEGIPILCEHIKSVDNISNIIECVSSTCKLNHVSKTDISKIKNLSNTTNQPTELLLKSTSTCEGIAHTDSATSSAASAGSANIKSEHSLITELQIRLPNGNRDTQTFPYDAILQQVRVFINVKYNLKDFDLKTYNHEVFSEEDYKKTLQDLDLYPNGVIIVVDKNVIPFNNGRGIIAVIHYGVHQFMTQTTSIYQYIRGLLFNIWNSFFFTNTGGDGQRTPQGGSRPTDQSSSQKGYKKSASKSFGNIHSLRRNDDSDDENNRYNGNSTQQK